jgi:Protein of unknown function (DUF3467)
MPEETGEFEEIGQEGKSRHLAGQLTIPFPEDFVYSNASAFGTSLMDVHISFAEVLPNGTIRAKVGVVIPAEHAAQIVLNLIEQIGLYEVTFGEIRHPAWKAFKDRSGALRETPGKTSVDAAPDDPTPQP